MKKRILLLNMLILSMMSVMGQEKHKVPEMPVLAVKTNALYWATVTPNLGVEFALSKKFTMDISGNYNPWKWSGSKKFKHWLVQPELRYWSCDRFNGHFFGIHAFYAQFNMCGIKMFDWEHKRYQGDLYGGGISYGYHWILGKRWSLEGTLDVGYAHITYDKYRCEKCGPKLKEGRRNYVGPTKIGINLIYIIK
ncbi:DUF3575 domain-containing protein [Butyricimonas synergistica]|uniref:DUF3575 domain-containing protein n=1 Tax=Butyricimonas synergistica TaxID=544644 RepID=UPI00037753C3